MSASPDFPTLTPDQFPILPWGWTPISPETLAGIRECGFNLAGFINPPDLDLVQQAGLKAIVFDPQVLMTGEAVSLSDQEIQKRVQALVSQVRGHPALFGYYLRDEPNVKDFPALARWLKAFRAADPSSLPYV